MRRLVLVSLAIFTTASMFAQSGFAPVVTYTTNGMDAQSISVADINGDNKPDLIVTNSNSGTVGVLLGNGDGTFQQAVIYSSGVGSDGQCVAVADINGDGKPDVLYDAGSIIGVLLGNGDGTLQPPVTYSSGGGQCVAVADVNGDGKPDIVNTIGVLLGNGDGTFQPAVTFSSGGAYIGSVAVADVNSDGKPDVIVNHPADNVSVLLGNGDGTFQPAVTYSSGGHESFSLAVADVNGDNKPDLVVANACATLNSCSYGNNGTVGVLLGNGDGTFQPAVTYSAGYYPMSVAVADVNGDGKPDLLFANLWICNNVVYSNCNTAAVSVLRGNGDGTFQPADTYSSNGDNGHFVAVADVNGDGKPDALVVNGGPAYPNYIGSVGVLINTATYSLAATSTVIKSSSNPSTYGQTTIFTATVTTSGPIKPTGTVKFMDGSTALGTTTLNGSGVTMFTTSSLTAGQHSISAIYGGDATSLTSTSPILNQVVNLFTSSTALTSTLNPALAGSSVTFVATVTTSGSPKPTGTVTFMDGSTTLGAVTLNASGIATFTTSSLTGGLHSITASYSGDAWNAASSSALNQIVNLFTTATALASSANPAMAGSLIAITATVTTSGLGMPTGSVRFADGSTTLGTATLSGSGVATYTTSSLTAGQHSITAVYGGDTSNAGSTSAIFSETVNTADFALSSSPGAATVSAGNSADFTITIVPKGSFSNSINFSCSGLPAVAGCIFSPAKITPNANTTAGDLTITTATRTASLASRPSGLMFATYLMLPAMLFVGVGLHTPQRRKLLNFGLLCLLAGSIVLQTACGCGKNGGAGSTGAGGTPAGTYTITVVGAASSIQRSTTLTLTVR